MRNKLIILLTFLVISVAGTALLFVYRRYIEATIAAPIAFFLFINLCIRFKNSIRKIMYLLNAIENDDFAFRFSDRINTTIREEIYFNRTLNRLKEIMANEKKLAREKEKYFELMLDNVITGIMTISDRGDVIFSNNKIFEMFGLSVLTHIDQLNKISENVAKKIAELTPDENLTVSFYNERGELFVSLKCNYVIIREKRLKVIAVNDIGKELEEKELDSWTRLIRVLTHEIINSITPISSLSETLSKNYDNINEEIKQGLEIISSTSKGLISFVDSYRQFTRIPEPVKKIVSAKALLHKLLKLYHEDFEKNHINTVIDTENEDIMIYIDENLILQALINLTNNALSSLKEKAEERKLIFNIQIDSNEDVIINVMNNGLPIAKEIQEQIFIPFFTTKSDGSGIGLSISRQIMRLHGGSLKLQRSNEKETVFRLIFR
jgi:nitrogen fixation/metabolism regulation signal transduction histidine kinase